jgi:hypothetical protein
VSPSSKQSGSYPVQWKANIRSSQTNRVGTQVDQVASMLREIHNWFSENLKDTTSANRPRSQGTSNSGLDVAATFQDFTFELYVETGTGPGHQIVCHRASLHPKWKAKSTEETSDPLFLCNCDQDCQSCDWQSHRMKVAAYTCKLNTCFGRCFASLTSRHALLRSPVNESHGHF